MAKVKIGDQEFELLSDNIEECIGWIDNDFYIDTTSGTICMKNAYWSGLKFEGLDDARCENITIIGNNKVWEKSSDGR